jgi:RHS repeat-associated protein
VLLAQPVLNGLTGGPAQAVSHANIAAPAKDKPVAVTPFAGRPVAVAPMPKLPAAKAAWPAPAAADALPFGGTAPASSTTAGTATGDGQARMARAGTLPVRVGPAAAGGPAPASAHVQVHSHAEAAAAGVSGLLVSVARSDGSSAATASRVGVDYASFADAYGGGWSNRLRLETLPACALTTPQLPQCRTGTPLASTNDTAAHEVSAPLALTASTTVLALDAAPSDSGGTFTATSLQTAGSWTAGGSSGAFSYSYPMAVPNVPGGLSPAVTLNYDSQSVDGRTSATNSQASWAGDGWDYNPGFIERSFASCANNPSGATKTGDTCWSADTTYTMSLGGHSTTLVYDATKGWHGQDDAGDRVQLLTGAVNGDHAGQYWVVTEQSGTQYYFGLNRLPGWTSGAATSNSAFYQPVYFPTAPPSSDPNASCYNSTFSSSWCTLAYRWSLDYVVDTHKDAIAYFYNQETNYYSPDNGSTATSGSHYTRAGSVSKILYGFRDGQTYSTSQQPAAEVLLTPSGRCDTSPTGCATSTISTTAKDWPDVPYDQNCTSGNSCSTISPTFWTENELSTVQTKILVGSTYQNVDSWQLAYSFPPTGDSTPAALWLGSITRTGQDALGGLPGGTAPGQLSLPPVTFTGQPLANRVYTNNGYEPITRYRMSKIVSEAGAVVGIGYQGVSCTSGTPTIDANSTFCYPQYWTPPLASTPILDWFNKYVVQNVSTSDQSGGSQPLAVQYSYGKGAWHFDDNPLTQAKYRTWDLWRGVASVTTDTGQSSDSSPVAEAKTLYMQGMDQDPNSSGGTTAASVTDWRNESIADSNWLAGRQREKIVSNGVGGATVSDDVTDFWAQQTAAQSRSDAGLATLYAYQVDTAAQRGYAPTSTGGTRATESDYSHDSYGRTTAISNLGDTATSADDTCTRTTYAQDTGRWVLNLPARVQKVSVACSATPSYPADVVSDSQNLYDSSGTAGAVTGAGDVTASQKADNVDSSGTPHYLTRVTSAVDEYGRPTAATDGLGRVTTTAYSPATGAAPTSVTVTAPVLAGQSAGFATTKTYDPARGQELTTTDAAGHEGFQTYDSLGRLTAGWAPQSSATPATTPPNAKFTYQISNGLTPSVVTTSMLDDTGTGYRTSEALYDSLLRQRESQAPTSDGNRTVSDVAYDSHGRKVLTSDPYYATGVVGTTLVNAPSKSKITQDGIVYDGADRQTQDITYYAGNEQWETDTAYNGVDETTVTPPGGAGGGTATSKYSDAFGRAVKVVKYDGASPSGGVATTTDFAYTADDKSASVTDTQGDAWNYTYNLLGQMVSQSDPDTANSTFTYDAAGQQITATDGRGKQITTAFDAMGRKKATYDTTGGAVPSSADEIASWSYDTIAKGYLSASTAYYNGAAYTSNVIGYTTYGQSKGTAVVIPSGEGGLAGTYVHQLTYTPAGQLATMADTADGGLPAETMSYQYDALGLPYGLSGTHDTYISDLTTDQFGDPATYTYGPKTTPAYLDLTYDPVTGRVATAATVVTAGGSRTVDDVAYGYNQASGNVTSISDVQSETGSQVTDTQCFGYDGLQRLTAAWTATDACAATPAPGNSGTVGGPKPYWQTYSYDPLGDRSAEVDHDVSGTVGNDVATSYQYPTAGSGAVQPNALASTTTTGPAGSALTQFAYDKAGNTLSVSDPVNGNQTMAWYSSGKLQSQTTAAGTTGYLYDADGNLLIRHDPGTSTLYLGDEQITANTSTSTVTKAVRYYSIGGDTIAARTATSGGATQDIQYLIPDREGTDQLAIDSGTQAVTRRQFLPYGGVRGSAPASWPGADKGYIGGVTDAGTGLETLGSRQYNPTTGRFLSTDPVLESTDPNQIGGYSYAADNPVTHSDPSGLRIDDPDTGCNGTASWVTQCIANKQRVASGRTPGSGTTSSGSSTNGGSGSIDPGACATQSCFLSLTNPAYAAQQRAYLDMINAEEQAKLALEEAAAAAAAQAQKSKQHCGWNPASWGSCAKDVGQFAYQASGLKDAVGCISNPSLGQCLSAVGNMALMVGTGGEGTLAEAFARGALETVGEDLVKDEGEQAVKDAVESCLIPHSFVGGTKVLMADGSARPIDEIKVGDKIRNQAPGEATPQEHAVQRVIITRNDHDFVDLTIATPQGPRTLTTTFHHKFWDVTARTWTEAADLAPGHLLQDEGSATSAILAVGLRHDSVLTYDLTIDSLHTYYVQAGDDPVLVHNCTVGGTGASDIPGVPIETSGLSLDEARAAGYPTELPPTELKPPPGYGWQLHGYLGDMETLPKNRVGRLADGIGSVLGDLSDIQHPNGREMPGKGSRW